MQTVNEKRLESEPQYRFNYLAEFIGFTSEDAQAIQAFAPHLGPRIGDLVDQTYAQLLAYDATARHFVPKQHGAEGPAPKNLAELSADHAQIRFRKDHLNRYFMQLIGRSYDEKMVQYIDIVGKMHTREAGNKEIEVPLVQMNALMGLLTDLVIKTVVESPLDAVAKTNTIRAFNKFFWIQNDFISRHYATLDPSDD